MTRLMCKNCGETMWEDELSRYSEDYGEVFECCPFCGIEGELEEVEECDVCGGEFEEDQVYRGICLKCLRDSVGYDVALAYILEVGDITEFILCDWFGADCVASDSVDLALFCEETFRRIVANEILLGEKAFLAALTDYCVPEDTYTADEERFADWLIKYQHKK